MARPQFYQMLQDAEVGDFKAILIDDLDRFSRAKRSEVRADMAKLVSCGVKILHTSLKRYPLDDEDDLGAELNLTIDIWANRQYSVKLSRRTALTRRNQAEDGWRTGGNAPYGYANTGSKYRYTLKLGPARQVKIVKWIFDQFANRGRPLTKICGELNRQKESGPTGKEWRVTTLSKMLGKTVYLGEFYYGKSHDGQFHGYDVEGNVVPSDKLNGEKWKGIRKANWYPAIIDVKTFNRAQKRLAEFDTNKAAGKLKHALAGILVCGHCETVLHGGPERGPGSKAIYKCNANRVKGDGTCNKGGRVREDKILPWLMGELGKQLKSLEELASGKSIRKTRVERRADKQRQRDDLEEKIKRNADPERLALLDGESFKEMSAKIKQWRQELQDLDEKLRENESTRNSEFWKMVVEVHNELNGFYKNAVRIPIAQRLIDDSKVYLSVREDDGPGVLVDRLVLNSYLRRQGAIIQLWWKDHGDELKGIPGRRVLIKGRYKLWETDKVREIPSGVLKTAAGRRA